MHSPEILICACARLHAHGGYTVSPKVGALPHAPVTFAVAENVIELIVVCSKLGQKSERDFSRN